MARSRRVLAATCLAGQLLGWAGCSHTPRGAPSSRMALDRWENPQRDAWSMPDRVVKALGLGQSAQDVVDLGAGSGYFSRRLAKENPHGRVLALEVSSVFRSYIESHKQAWGTPNLETRLVIDNNPLLAQASVDLVFMSNTYRYLPDRAKYFQDLSAALRAKGRVAIVDFRSQAQCSKIPDCPPDKDRVSAKQVQQEMQAAGFELLSSHDFLPHQYYLVFQKPATPQATETALPTGY